MSRLGATRALRAAADLRALCLALPHLPSPAEAERLRRFDVLAGWPGSVTPDDVEALATGWALWWRLGRTHDLHVMARGVSDRLIQSDRRLAAFSVAAAMALGAPDGAATQAQTPVRRTPRSPSPR